MTQSDKPERYQAGERPRHCRHCGGVMRHPVRRLQDGETVIIDRFECTRGCRGYKRGKKQKPCRGGRK